MASDHRGWLGLTLVSCLLATCLASFIQSAKPVNDGSSLFLTKRAEGHRCCPLSGLPWDARAENGTVPRPKKMAFMLGAQKAGTSYMFDQLVNRHPYIRPQRPQAKGGIKTNDLEIKLKRKVDVIKEVHYFDRVAMSDFASFVNPFNHQQDDEATYIDATPDYMHIPSAACRIADAFPDAKLVILLKDPVQRALSGWNMIRHKDLSSVGSFAAEVAEEIRLLRGFGCSYEGQQRMPSITATNLTEARPDKNSPRLRQILNEERAKGGPFQQGWRVIRKAAKVMGPPGTSTPTATSWIVSPDPASQPYRPWKLPEGLPSWNDCFICTFSYCYEYNNNPPGPPETCRQDLGRGSIRRGLYAYQIEWWLRHFKPEQLLIVNSEEVRADSEAAIDRIVAFLGQDPSLKRKVSAQVVQDKYGFKTTYADVSFSAEDTIAIDKLYRYYSKPNDDLYHLLESLPHSSTYGWFENSSKVVRADRKFPTSFSKARVSRSQAMLVGRN